MLRFFRRSQLIDRVSDGNTEYFFTRPVDPERAAKEFRHAREQGKPTGTTILIP